MKTDSSFKLELYGKIEKEAIQDEYFFNEFEIFDPTLSNKEYNTTVFPPNVQQNTQLFKSQIKDSN